MPNTGSSRGILHLAALVALVVTTATGCYQSVQNDRPRPHPAPAVSEVRRGDDPAGPTKSGKSESPIASTPGSVKHERTLPQPTPDKTRKAALAPLDTPPHKISLKPSIEPLSGYEIPCEYFRIDSRNYPEGITAVCLPPDYRSNSEKRYPLVIAFGGAGECARPSRQSALAWVGYYQLDRAAKALQDNRVEARDFKGLATEKEIAGFNERLALRPYEGVILACPASPPLKFFQGKEIPRYEAFIMEELVPALMKHYRVRSRGLGVDGVSMGGARSLYYGLKYPEIFHSIGAIQGAFGPYMDLYRSLVRAKRKAISTRPIQLVTSDGDVMAPSVKQLSRLLEDHGIFSDFRLLSGPHDYIFNQGPGSLALLAFHDEALRRSPVGPIQRSRR